MEGINVKTLKYIFSMVNTPYNCHIFVENLGYSNYDEKLLKEDISVLLSTQQINISILNILFYSGTQLQN